MKRPALFITAFALFLAAFLLFPPKVAATELFVDCTGTTPATGSSLQGAIDSLDFIGPHTIHILGGPCTENIWIIDRQRLTITAEGIGVFIDSAGGHTLPAMYISGSTGIVLVQIGFTNASMGLLIDRASEVTLTGCTVGGGNTGGIAMYGNSSLYFLSNLVTGNSRNGITAVDSEITFDGDNTIQNNGRYGVVLRKSHGVISSMSTLIQGNNMGLGVVASTIEIYGPVNIQNNMTGMNVMNGGSASLYGDADNPINITSNSWTGINTDAACIILSDGVHVTNNGFGMQPLHAGVRVDDNTTLTASGAEIAGNSGPGIDAINAGVINLAGSIVSNNSADGIRLIGNSSALVYPPNNNIVSANGGMTVNCDGTSVFSGDRTGLGQIACKYAPIIENNAKTMKRMMVPAVDEKAPKRQKR